MNENKSQKLMNVMIDLETLGTSPGCVILSIGATVFDLSCDSELPEDCDRHFYTSIDKDSCTSLGLTIDQATLTWWSEQDPEARREALCGSAYLPEALENFAYYLKQFKDLEYSIRVWGNSASFDLKILEAAYVACKLPVPWNFRDEMCYRTLRNLPHGLTPQESAGIHHHALHDAVYQAEFAQKILRRMRSGN